MIPEFKTIDEKFAWLAANKSLLITRKKSQMKCADAFACGVKFAVKDVGLVLKSDMVPKDVASIDVVAVINTTKLFDSYADVHFDGLWNKSIQETKKNYLVKSHNFNWDGVITDQVKVSAVNMNWKELGFDYKGETQALVYASTIVKEEDPTGMFDKYRTGKVDQHSVGMQYVKVDLALPTKKYEDEYKVWKNYFDQIVNGAEAEAAGYFWAVTEAKNIEGSAVLRGANFATPTVSVQESKEEPGNPLPQSRVSTLSLDEVLKNYQPKNYLK